MKPIKLLPALLALAGALHAQMNSYDYYKELKPVTETGYYQIKVGSSVLDREGHYRVYEVNDNDSIEVPHVLSSGNWDVYQAKYFRDLKIIDKSYEKGKFSYATLVVDTNIIYSSVYINFSVGEYFKDVTLEGSHDNKSWKTIIENEKLFSYFPLNDRGYLKNRIDFEPVSFKFLRIKVKTDDSESPGLALVSASIPLIKKQPEEEYEFIHTTQTRSEDKKMKCSYIECLFPRAYSITGLELKVSNDGKYHRIVRIEAYNPVNGKERWVTLGEGIISSESSNKLYLANYSYEDIKFKSAKIRLVIENLDDRPLEKVELKPFTRIEVISLKLEKDKKYLLAYGKKNDQLPQYDLEYFRNAIPLNLKTAELGNEMKIAHTAPEVQKPLVNDKMWIWVVLIGCVLLIGLFALKLLKLEPKDQ